MKLLENLQKYSALRYWNLMWGVKRFLKTVITNSKLKSIQTKAVEKLFYICGWGVIRCQYLA